MPLLCFLLLGEFIKVLSRHQLWQARAGTQQCRVGAWFQIIGYCGKLTLAIRLSLMRQHGMGLDTCTNREKRQNGSPWREFVFVFNELGWSTFSRLTFCCDEWGDQTCGEGVVPSVSQ